MASSFQAVSASTTDGFNSVDIGTMSSTSLFMIILLMFIGRVGPLTLGLALAEKPAPLFRYPEGEIFVG